MSIPSSEGDRTSLEKLSQEPRLIKRTVFAKTVLLILLRADRARLNASGSRAGFEGVRRTRNGDLRPQSIPAEPWGVFRFFGRGRGRFDCGVRLLGKCR